MTSERDAHAGEGLTFFGAVSASISHELKNHLAIISQQAGMLEDAGMMAEKGMELSPEKLMQLGDRLQAQVRRADQVLKNMNAFAHLVDEPSRKVDLVQSLELMVALCVRFASQKTVELELSRLEQAEVATDPFLLEFLLFDAIRFALDNPGPSRRIGIGVHAREREALITLSGLEANAPAPPERLNELARALSGRVRYGDNELRLALDRA